MINISRGIKIYWKFLRSSNTPVSSDRNSLTFIFFRCDSSQAYRRERLTSVTARLAVRHSRSGLFSAIMRAKKRVISHPPPPSHSDDARLMMLHLYLFVHRDPLALSLSFFLFFSLSIFTRSLSRVTLKPSRLSLWSNGPSYQMYISVAILDFASRRMSRRERFSGPTGTDWTPAKRQPGGRPSCSCARDRSGRTTRHWTSSGTDTSKTRRTTQTDNAEFSCRYIKFNSINIK